MDVIIEVKELPGEDEIFIKGDGAVVSTKLPERGVEYVINTLPKLSKFAKKEYIGLRITLDGKCRDVLSVEPKNLFAEVEEALRW